MVKKILVIDGNSIVTEALEDILKRKGYEEVVIANSGEEALQLIKKENPDLVLLDIIMPQMDGIETLKKIRKIAPNLEVIMLTGSTELEYEARKIGVSDFLHKELGLEVFIKTVNRVLGEREKEEKPKEKKELRILVVDDDTEVQDLLSDFLTKKGYN